MVHPSCLKMDFVVEQGPPRQYGDIWSFHGFSRHVWMWELDHKESWVLKNWCFWTVVLEKTLESPLDYKEIQPVTPKGNQSWIFNGRTDAEAPILWPPDAKHWLIGKDPDAGEDWGQEEKGTTEDEMVGWHHRLNGHEFEQTPGVGDGQGGLACRSPWGREESETTEGLNWTDGVSLSLFEELKLLLLVFALNPLLLPSWLALPIPARPSLPSVNFHSPC